MSSPSHRVRVGLAAALAFSLLGAISFPGSGSGPLSTPAASALTYVRVASLGPATRADWLKLGRLGISMGIRNGILGLSPSQISTRYAFHYPGTSWPGGGSNTYLYAHARSGAFLKLKYAVRGDIITMRLATGAWVKYRVTGKYNVAWNAGIWVFPTSYERITLQTCLGSGPTARKLMVVAVPAY